MDSISRYVTRTAYAKKKNPVLNLKWIRDRLF